MKTEENLAKFRIELRELRKMSGLTQKQVAEKLCITHQSYQAYETGKTIPTLQNFLTLCEIFNITPNDMLDIDD